MNKWIAASITVILFFCGYIMNKASASGPSVSLGTHPAHVIYSDCANGTATTIFTNTTSNIFLITDVWATTSAPGGNGAADISIDGSTVFSVSGTSNRSIALTTQTGIPV